MSEKGSKKLFEKFCSYFPEVELPVTLSEEYTSIFTRFNKALPMELIQNFILEEKLYFADEPSIISPEEEFEEYVPCFSLPNTQKFKALIYWKAGLLKYEYILHTYDEFGRSIARQVLASTSSDGKRVRQIVATIDPDMDIFIMGGDTEQDHYYDPENSKAFSLEITPEGQILHHYDEN